MSVQNIVVNELEAGLVRLEEDTEYSVPAQRYSALYMPENKKIILSIEGRDQHVIPPGAVACLPTGLAHTICLTSGPCKHRAELQPPFEASMPPEREEDAGVAIFAARVPTSANPVADIVPSFIYIDDEQLQAAQELGPILKLIRDNVVMHGNDKTHVTRRLAEIVAMSLIEHSLEKLTSEGLNTAQGVGDTQLRRAIVAIHETPDQDWSLEQLARHAGLSRSVFAERFKQVLGETPMTYLAQVRMARGTMLLKTSDLSVSEIAYRCGYQSDTAFHKAFKRLVGMTPKEYRQSHAT
ncbi:MAG: AraC family transcriptional regulator [Henriciella sp.]|nr:AraC family transcriptional regulator [Henriciella sp.]